MKKKKFDKKRRTKGDLFTYLMKHYVASFFLTGVCMIGVAVMFAKISVEQTFSPINGIKKQIELIDKGDFKNINIHLIAGEKGGIKIFDEEEKVVFKGGLIKDKVIKLSEIQTLSGTYQYISKSNYIDDFGKSVTLITKNSWEDDEQSWYVLLDENMKPINYSHNFPWKKKSYTQEDIWNITNSYKITKNEYKYEFETDKGEEYTMIIFLGSDVYDYNEKVEKILAYTPLILLLVFIICTLIFLIILSRKIKKPINELNEAMKSYSKGERVGCIMSRAPKEFININDTFNLMIDKIRESEEREKHYTREKQRIIADISHDLKTPITIINGYAKALEDGKIKAGEEQKYLSIIRSKSADMTNLINMFHEYSKMEHPEYNLSLQRRNLSEVIRLYIAEIYDYVYDLGFIIEIDIDDRDIYLSIDEFQMKRAVWNILSNAIKYNSRGTILRIKLSEKGNLVILEIGDNGIGISEEIKSTIFEAFVVGDDARSSTHGTGLGLAITKKIINKHGGEIRLECDGDFKTNFVMEFNRS